MRRFGLGVTLLLVAAGCAAPEKGAGPAARDSGGRAGDGFVVLDESEEFWIVKVWKRGGAGAPHQAAAALRDAPPAGGEKRLEAHAEGPDAGRVRGRIVRKGQGVPGCSVKLAPMRRNLGVLQWEESYGAEPTALTDAAGSFEIRGVPAGAYRLKWLVPGDSSWFKRLKERPDVLVEAGKVGEAAEVELSRQAR